MSAEKWKPQVFTKNEVQQISSSENLVKNSEGLMVGSLTEL